MRAANRRILITLVLLAPVFAVAQRQQHDPLTSAQVEQIREAGIDPVERVKLYTKFLDEHANTLRGLTDRAKTPARAHRIDDELQDFTSLMDELASNLDTYSDRKADIRKALKPLNDAMPRWLGILHGLLGEPAFDLSRKEAIESGEDLADQAKRMLDEQTEYFRIHKDEAGQDRYEPNPVAKPNQ